MSSPAILVPQSDTKDYNDVQASIKIQDSLTASPITASGLQLKPDLCYFGSVNDRGTKKTFGILEDDRRRHMYILGKTGMGKTTLLENMILQDIHNGKGVCFIDAHGDPSEYILDRIPPFRQNDVIYFDPADTEWPIGFNMLEAKRGEEAFLIVSGMMAVFNRIWSGMWSARMEYILSNTLLALLETQGNTLLGVVRMLTDADFRDKTISNVKDPMVRNFWLREFAGFNDKYRSEAIAPVLNKIGQFFSTDLIRNILGQVKSTIDMRDIMDKKKILIVNLAKGRIGEDNSALLGSLLVTKIQLAAMSRVDIAESQRNDFYLYVDEFQNFTTDSFATILSEARKYRLNLVLAHQYIAQLTETGNEKIKNAIFGNVGTTISFRIGAEDAMKIEREFVPVFNTEQLINLDKTQIALKLSIHGKATSPFLANTLPPIFEYDSGRIEIIRGISRERYGTAKATITDKINRWLSEGSETSLSKSQKRKQKKNNAYLKPTKSNQDQEDGEIHVVAAKGIRTTDQKKSLAKDALLPVKFDKLNDLMTHHASGRPSSHIKQNPKQIQVSSQKEVVQLPLKKNIYLEKLNQLKNNKNFSSAQNGDLHPGISTAQMSSVKFDPSIEAISTKFDLP